MNLEHNKYNSVDEQIIPTKCNSLINKPNKRWYKVLSRCGVSEIIYNLNIYTGESDQRCNLGVSGAMVVKS